MREAFFALAVLILIGCSEETGALRETKDPRAIRLANRMGIDFPEVAPESGFALISCKSFQIRPVDILDYVYSQYGTQIESVAGRPRDEQIKNFETTGRELGIRSLIINDALRNNVRAAQAEIDSMLNERYKSAGGEEKFLEYLKTWEIRMEDVVENLRKHILLTKHLQNIYDSVEDITEQDLLEAYLEEKVVSTQHIFLSTEGKTEEQKEEVWKRMEMIAMEANAGRDFADLAAEYSEDPKSKKHGGFANRRRVDMDDQLEQVLFSLKIGEISDVIEMENAFMLFKVVNKVQETRPLEEVRDELRSILKFQRRKEAYEELLARLKKEENYKFTPFNEPKKQESATN